MGKVAEQAPLWKELDRVLAPRHYAPGHDAIDTVNRLLRKNPRVKETIAALQLARDRLEIAEETWELPKLVSLLHPSQHTDDEPQKPTGAIVIVRRGALEFLIDGRRRINYWKRNSVIDPHRVLVISEKGQ